MADIEETINIVRTLTFDEFIRQSVDLIGTTNEYPNLETAQDQLTLHLMGLSDEVQELKEEIKNFIERIWSSDPDGEGMVGDGRRTSRSQFERLITDRYIRRHYFLPYPFTNDIDVIYFHYICLMPLIPSDTQMGAGTHRSYSRDELFAILKYPFRFLNVDTVRGADLQYELSVFNEFLNTEFDSVMEQQPNPFTARISYQRSFLSRIQRRIIELREQEITNWEETLPNLETILEVYHGTIAQYEEQIRSVLDYYTEQYINLNGNPFLANRILGDFIRMQKSEAMAVYTRNRNIGNNFESDSDVEEEVEEEDEVEAEVDDVEAEVDDEEADGEVPESFSNIDEVNDYLRAQLIYWIEGSDETERREQIMDEIYDNPDHAMNIVGNPLHEELINVPTLTGQRVREIAYEELSDWMDINPPVEEDDEEFQDDSSEESDWSVRDRRSRNRTLGIIEEEPNVRPSARVREEVLMSQNESRNSQGLPLELRRRYNNDLIDGSDEKITKKYYTTILSDTDNDLFTYMYNPLYLYDIYMKYRFRVDDITSSNIADFIYDKDGVIILPSKVGINDGQTIGYSEGVERNIRFFAKNALEELLFKKMPSGVCSSNPADDDEDSEEASISYTYVFNFDLPLETLNNYLFAMISFLELENEALTLNYPVNILPMLWDLFFKEGNRNKYAIDISILFDRVFSGIVNESGVQLTPERVAFKEAHPEYFNSDTLKEIDINSDEYKLYSYLVMLYCNEYKQEFRSQPKLNTPGFNEFFKRYTQITSADYVDPFAGDSDNDSVGEGLSLEKLMAATKSMQEKWKPQEKGDEGGVEPQEESGVEPQEEGVEGGVQTGGHGNPQLIKELGEAIMASPEFEGLRYTLNYINTAQLAWSDMAKLYNLLTLNSMIDSSDATYMGIFGLFKHISKSIPINIGEFKKKIHVTIPDKNSGVSGHANLTIPAINTALQEVEPVLLENPTFTQFWELLDQLSQEELHKLLWFWSGTPNILGGKVYQVKLTFEPQPGFTYYIPTAGTCYTRLDMGREYADISQMKEALFAAINSESMTAAAYEGGKGKKNKAKRVLKTRRNNTSNKNKNKNKNKRKTRKGKK